MKEVKQHTDEYDNFDDVDESELERRAIEARKRRREALLAKYEQEKEKKQASQEATASQPSAEKSAHDADADTSHDFTKNLKGKMGEAHEGISAADYTDNLDRREDVNDEGDKPPPQPASDASDDDDMFALSSEHLAKKQKTSHRTSKASLPIDGSTDADGYYTHTFGETLDGRYTVFAALGSGMFSNVVRVKDTRAHNAEYAVKIIRAQESMRRVALKEVALLERLKQLDADDRKHVIRIERTFEHRGHLCIVFEGLR